MSPEEHAEFLEAVKAVRVEFLLSRGLAVEAYAGLEHKLCDLFAYVAGTSREASPIIFFKITNTGARNAILEKLLRLRHGTDYNLFWNSFVKMLGQTDVQRNEVVHWTYACWTDEELPSPPKARLLPAHGDWPPTTPYYDAERLNAFASKCRFLTELCMHFVIHLTPNSPWKSAITDAWLDIFRQPITYPIPATHPLHQNPPAPESPPPPSPE